MTELEEVDLAKALAIVVKETSRAARDIMLELKSPERTDELITLIEDALSQLRGWRSRLLPTVIDGC